MRIFLLSFILLITTTGYSQLSLTPTRKNISMDVSTKVVSDEVVFTNTASLFYGTWMGTWMGTLSTNIDLSAFVVIQTIQSDIDYLQNGTSTWNTVVNKLDGSIFEEFTNSVTPRVESLENGTSTWNTVVNKLDGSVFTTFTNGLITWTTNSSGGVWLE